MKNREEQLLEILSIGHVTSMRGKGISLCEALTRTRYKKLRADFSPSDLVPLIKAHQNIAAEWIAYSEDKRTSGGWYLLENSEIGQVGHPKSKKLFSSLDEAVAEYVVRELVFCAEL